MQRQLPSELNLHILSFLTPDEVIKTKQINKISKIMAEVPSFWKSRLKDELGIIKVNDITKSYDEYKKSCQQLMEETKFYSTLIEAFLLSLEIKRCTISGVIQDPLDQFRMIPLTIEAKNAIASREHFFRIHRLDNALLRSKEVFNQEFKKLKELYPQINHEEIKSLAINFGTQESNDKCKSFLESLSQMDKIFFSLHMLLAPAKADAYVLIRFLNREGMLQNFLGDLLHVACSFLNIKTAQVLIELGANVNHFKEDCNVFGTYSQTTPLFEVIAAIRAQRIGNPEQSIEPAKELVNFLLKNGADPHARIFIADEDDRTPDPNTEAFEGNKKSISEICLMAKENPGDVPVEILDLIITASNLDEANDHNHKRRRLG